MRPRLFLLYHELRSSGSNYSYVMDTSLFERHVALFGQLRKAQEPALWPEVAFDDGHISNIELAAPILESQALTAQFFITVGWTGKRAGYMGWPELRALHGAGHPVGAHGWTHTLLTHCSHRELQTELGGARRALEDGLGAPVTTMSLPGGRYNRRVLAACADAGYLQVYSSVPRAEAVWDEALPLQAEARQAGPLPRGATIGRLNVRGDMQVEWLARLFQPGSTALAGLGRQYRVKQAAKAVLGDRLYARLWALANRQERDGDGGGDLAE